jgi:hypothetical protein
MVVLWMLAGLGLLDGAVNLLFPYPSDPKATGASTLQLYFDYGRSTEGKLRRATRASRDQTAPITLAGWYRPLEVYRPGEGEKGATVSFYGMSHSVRLAEALERTSSRYSARSVGAPGATANWAFGAFLRDGGNQNSKAAVLSIMSITAPMVTTLSAMTWNSAFPVPYTADRFLVRQGKLQVVHPPYDRFEDYVRTIGDPTQMAEARKIFRRYDTSYDDFLMRETPLDASAIVRMARRAYGLRKERDGRAKVLTGQDYEEGSEQVRVLNALVAEFAQRARQKGIVPVVYLVNNYGYGDTLWRALRATIEAHAIPTLSSHHHVSPSDPRAYLPDSHFTDANDEILARALERLIDEQTTGTTNGPAGPRSLRN